MRWKRCRLIEPLVAVLALPVLMAGCSEDLGNPRFFADQTYHYETLRIIGNAVSGGADIGEVQTIIAEIRAGDEQGWFEAWNRMARRMETRAHELRDPTSKGLAWMRAHNYYRSAEFLLPPEDEKRRESYRRSIESFRSGLQLLGVEHEFIQVPYGEQVLPATYYPGPPGSERRPLLVAAPGFDGTQEEVYFKLAPAAHARGYSLLTYEGPGHGAPLRDSGLQFTHEWERPVGAVLDAFLASHPRPEAIVLFGSSLGGYLAPRAAAFDERIDGVVSYGVMFDFLDTVRAQSPPWIRPLVALLAQGEWTRTLSLLQGLRARTHYGARWAFGNMRWTMGASNLIEIEQALEAYSLADIAHLVNADVLVLHGADDHMIPSHQLDALTESLVNARSLTVRVHDRASGGQEHCHQGATLLWHEDLFDWLAEKFPPEG